MKIDNSVHRSVYPKFWSEGAKITGMIAVAVIVIVMLVMNMLSGFSSSETITVEGVSEISVMPDRLSVYLNVETLEASANVAKDKNAEIVAKVKDALIAAGFDREDFETQNFNVYEEFDWTKDERKSVGFKATHSIVVSVDAEDESMIGVAIDAAVNNGALLGYVNFALSQELENEYKALALKMAAEDAKVKGEAVADGLGARLGKVVSTSMGSDFRYYPMMAYDNALGASVKGEEVATNIQVGEQTINAQISVIYKIR
ncbi:MAG: SIMPL domain-containing protein [archaeon]